jgi:hypothetical protein
MVNDNRGEIRAVPIWQVITTVIICRVDGTSIWLNILLFFSQQLLYMDTTLLSFPYLNDLVPICKP